MFRREGIPGDLVVRSATSVAAEILGLDGEIGTLAPGKRADVVALAGDPLNDVGAFGRDTHEGRCFGLGARRGRAALKEGSRCGSGSRFSWR